MDSYHGGVFAFTKIFMLNNPDIITGLIGFDGLLAIAITAILTRLFSDSKRAATLEAAKDTTIEKIAAVESTVKYVQGRVQGLTEILSDGSVTPAEVELIKSEATLIRDKIAGIVNPGGSDEEPAA